MSFTFEKYLKSKNLSQNTQKVYLFTVKQYQSKYIMINEKNLQAYKTFLVDNYKIKTVNLRIQAINTYLKYLKKDKNYYWYFVIRFITATGARVSELVQFKVEHVKIGYFDLYSKGGKLRRIYIPSKLQEEALKWFESINLTCVWFEIITVRLPVMSFGSDIFIIKSSPTKILL